MTLYEQVRALVEQNPDGIACTEIARRTGSQPNTVNSYLHRLQAKGLASVYKISNAAYAKPQMSPSLAAQAFVLGMTMATYRERML